ncbi:mechanosensitive ion channel protein MscS [Terasakiispira papahanaumokuakeensis]|uniref:Mechanosensitive ion channel protein MscS n=2 Tax=Terasakiispira papahanaumokuakeensis TaxID=197479 RepID=A0A1E2VDV1_9GAMM|nr:mechanosensitive ion channel protein MscS [Terasakiispira papahanaumokuakeensis]
MLPKEYAWVIQLFIVVLLTLTLNYIAKRFFDRLAQRFERTKNQWDDTLLDAARKPLGMLIWLVGLFWAMDIVRANSDVDLFDAVEPVRRIAVIAMMAWFMIRLAAGLEQQLMEPGPKRRPMDATTAQAVGKLLKASVLITALLVMLQTLGFSVSGVLAFGGVGGIAVGFAARDLLANFFGALMIYLDRPFKVGDWVRSPDKNIEGTVEEIGWRLTRVRTFDQRPLYVPNATFASISVENPSRMFNRRIYETVGIRYQDAEQMASIVEAVKQMLIEHDQIETDNQVLIVSFDNYGPSSLDFFVYTFTKTINWVRFHEIKQEILLKVYEIIRDHGADIAFPTSTLHLPDPIQIYKDQAEHE